MDCGWLGLRRPPPLVEQTPRCPLEGSHGSACVACACGVCCGSRSPHEIRAPGAGGGRGFGSRLRAPEESGSDDSLGASRQMRRPRRPDAGDEIRAVGAICARQRVLRVPSRCRRAAQGFVLGPVLFCGSELGESIRARQSERSFVDSVECEAASSSLVSHEQVHVVCPQVSDGVL